jgi:hypothetical protein
MTQHGRPTRGATQRRLAGIVAALALIGTGTQPAIAAVRTPRRPPVAAAARSTSITEDGELFRVHASGEIITEEGNVTGTLAGSAKVLLDVGAEVVTASFRITVRGVGSIVGHASAKLSSPGRHSSFRGTLSVTGGSGRYAHAHGSGKLYGTLERVSDHLTVQTREGTLHY